MNPAVSTSAETSPCDERDAWIEQDLQRDLPIQLGSGGLTCPMPPSPMRAVTS